MNMSHQAIGEGHCTVCDTLIEPKLEWHKTKVMELPAGRTTVKTKFSVPWGEYQRQI